MSTKDRHFTKRHSPANRSNRCNGVSGNGGLGNGNLCNGEHGEQRIKSRFQASALAVTLNRRSCLGLVRSSHSTHCVDINRYGVGLISPTPLPRGSRISLDFQGQYITQYDVQAEVVCQTPVSGGGYRLGLRFLYCAYQKAYCRRLDNALSRIEAMCRQKNTRQQKKVCPKALPTHNSHLWHRSGTSY